MPISEWDREHMDEIIGGEGDWFTAHLLRLMNKADAENRAILGILYPNEYMAFLEWKSGISAV